MILREKKCKKKELYPMLSNILERRSRRSGPARPERLLWGDRPAAGPSPGCHRDRPRPAQVCETGSCPVRAGTRPMRGHSQTKHYAVQQLCVTIGLNVMKIQKNNMRQNKFKKNQKRTSNVTTQNDPPVTPQIIYFTTKQTKKCCMKPVFNFRINQCDNRANCCQGNVYLN